jgi:hypothetical protein
MHLITKHHFHNTADIANEPGRVVLMRLHFFSNGSINRLGILSWHHPRHMLDMHIKMRINVDFSYFGTLGHHYHDFTQCPNKPGIL